MNAAPSIMSGKTVIVTGVSSFVGAHLAHEFAAANDRVIAVTSRPQSRYEGVRARRLAYVEDNVDFRVCDLCDADALAALIDACQPDVWVQHAGYADNYASRDYDLHASLALNVVALEPLYKRLASSRCGVIVTGSSMEYAPCEGANTENDVCWPELPYGVSKLAETIEASRLSRQYAVPTRVARLYIPIGPLDAPEKLLDFVIQKLSKGEVADLSACTQRRDFVSVFDIAQAYGALIEDMDKRSKIFDVFNICSGTAVELKSLLLDLARLMGADEALLNFGVKPMRPGEPMVSYGDNTKAKALLSWRPHSIQSALQALL